MFNIKKLIITIILILLVQILSADESACIDVKYPNLASGILAFAKLKDLPEKIILQTDMLSVTEEEIINALKRYPYYLSDQLEKNLFFVLEQESVRMIILAEARKQELYKAEKDDDRVIRKYLEATVSDVMVSEKEITEFYNSNKDLFGGAALNQMNKQIRQYLLQQKKQDFINQYIKEFGKKAVIYVSKAWVEKQVPSAFDNPVNKALQNGKITMAVFSNAGCCGPDVVKPIIDVLKKKHENKLNIIYIDPKEEQVLAARFNVFSVPTFIFFDNNGSEKDRENGNLLLEQIESRISEMQNK